ncbi:MAG: hypothetical protein ACRDJ5_09180 [Actinomycetota bacterium]
MGRKVSLRYALHGDPQHPFSEAIGVLQTVGPADGGDCLTIVDRGGDTKRIPVDDVLAAKLFP